MAKKVLLIFLILPLWLSLYSASNIRKRQVIVYNAPFYIRPGVKYYPPRYLKGGTHITYLSAAKDKKGEVYLRILYANKSYYIKKSHTEELNAGYPPHFAFKIGAEKMYPPLPFYYEPRDLKKLGLYVRDAATVFVRREAAIAFTTMANEAKLEGVEINAAYGYISVGSYSKDYLAQKKVWGDFLPKAMAAPSVSFLHTGVMMYVTTPEIKNDVCDHFYFTKAYKWLKENIRHYGFEFLPFTNMADFRPYAIRYKANPSSFFKIHKNSLYKFFYKCSVIALKEFKKRGRTDVNYLVIHDDENTATKGMFYALKKYGGYGIELVNINNYNGRNIKISLNGQSLYVDPNRIFTKENAEKNMRRWSKNYSEKNLLGALEKLDVIKDVILDAVSLSSKRYLLAIHTNNPHGRLSVHTFVNARIRENYYIYINPKMHKKSFYYVVDKKDYDYFRSKKMNVICLKKWNPVDGSLAFRAYKLKAKYITIECADGDEKRMKILIDEALKLVKLRQARR